LQNSHEKAIQELKNALKVNPKSFAAHMTLGSIYEQKGDQEAAKFQYREALNLEPQNPAAANNLAWNLAETGGDLDEALKLAQMAKDKLPKMTSVADTLGWVHYKKGSYAAAIDFLKECVSKEPKNATFQYHLGMAYFKNGRRAEARTSLSEALRLSPSFPGAEEAKQTLAKL
jgi:Flp pilus assembly protein TadD